MTALPRASLTAMFLRSFAVQGSWNYRTLIGCGFAFALLPVLRSIYADRPDEYRIAVQRHTALFNSHPYLAPMALGAVAVLESSEPPEVVDRFKAAVRGSLGSLGDRLIWTGFRPACILIALAAAVLGAGWTLVVFGFLIMYNIGHLATRIWAFRFGLRHGRRLGEHLREVPVERLQNVLQGAGAFALGLVLVLTLAGRSTMPQLDAMLVVAGVVAAAVGARFGGAVRQPIVLVLAGFALIGVVAGLLS